MRILHIDSGREMRGGQFQSLALMRGLAERGHEQLMLARDASPLYLAAKAGGLAVLPVSTGAVFKWSRRMELTHAHDAHSHTLAAVAGGSPVVVARRVAFPVGTGVLSRWKYGRAARFIAISQCVRQELLRAGIPESRADVVYDGTMMPDAASAGSRVTAPATSDPRKGSSLAREAAREAGVELMFSPDLRRDLPQTGVFVYLSESEGLGSAILFAMAHGIPVIASRVGGIPEIVEHEVTGLLVENDARAVADALRRLLGDRNLAARLGQAARRCVQEKFTMDAMIDGTLAVYARL